MAHESTLLRCCVTPRTSVMFTVLAIPYCEDHIEPSLDLPPDSTAWKYDASTPRPTTTQMKFDKTCGRRGGAAMRLLKAKLGARGSDPRRPGSATGRRRTRAHLRLIGDQRHAYLQSTTYNNSPLERANELRFIQKGRCSDKSGELFGYFLAPLSTRSTQVSTNSRCDTHVKSHAGAGEGSDRRAKGEGSSRIVSFNSSRQLQLLPDPQDRFAFFRSFLSEDDSLIRRAWA
ncbi:hypothetical protein DFH08DRAFT_807370 [Mycena albidolilacea]|uniref:Uncharacterized protein n=1 Tax=Mycena albidolilacea TaxID=1033008 RepID=A0AAD7A6M8_9AGAR|nr:hypothetical protein DFH08DRAFT_807370 [Mycena albidolilacea]